MTLFSKEKTVDRLFGFGTLVNTGTLSVKFLDAKRSYVTGFRRDWCMPFAHDGRRFVGLGLVRDHTIDTPIRGLTIALGSSEAKEIYHRERKYKNVQVDATDQAGNVDRTVTFEGFSVFDAFIPLSYLATVVEGFDRYYGEAGAIEFLQTTEFEDRIIFDDRESYVYRRTKIEKQETFKLIFDSLDCEVCVAQ